MADSTEFDAILARAAQPDTPMQAPDGSAATSFDYDGWLSKLGGSAAAVELVVPPAAAAAPPPPNVVVAQSSPPAPAPNVIVAPSSPPAATIFAGPPPLPPLADSPSSPADDLLGGLASESDRLAAGLLQRVRQAETDLRSERDSRRAQQQALASAHRQLDYASTELARANEDRKRLEAAAAEFKATEHQQLIVLREETARGSRDGAVIRSLQQREATLLAQVRSHDSSPSLLATASLKDQRSSSRENSCRARCRSATRRPTRRLRTVRTPSRCAVSVLSCIARCRRTAARCRSSCATMPPYATSSTWCALGPNRPKPRRQRHAPTQPGCRPLCSGSFCSHLRQQLSGTHIRPQDCRRLQRPRRCLLRRRCSSYQSHQSVSSPTAHPLCPLRRHRHFHHHRPLCTSSKPRCQCRWPCPRLRLRPRPRRNLSPSCHHRRRSRRSSLHLSLSAGSSPSLEEQVLWNLHRRHSCHRRHRRRRRRRHPCFPAHRWPALLPLPSHRTLRAFVWVTGAGLVAARRRQLVPTISSLGSLSRKE